MFVEVPGRKRQFLPPEHLHASGALARAITEGRLPEERGRGLGYLEPTLVP